MFFFNDKYLYQTAMWHDFSSGVDFFLDFDCGLFGLPVTFWIILRLASSTAQQHWDILLKVHMFSLLLLHSSCSPFVLLLVVL